MTAVEKRFALNVAQLRNLRNWAVDDRVDKTIPVVVRPPRPTPPAEAAAAVRALVGRHEALRSRLAGAEQEVLTTEEIDVECGSETPGGPVPVAPDERACRAFFLLREGKVDTVTLTVSHVFTDAFGVQALTGELTSLLAGEPVAPQPRQASDYADGPEAPHVRENTAYWRELLGGAPRACTYSGVERDEYEKVEIAQEPLTPELDALVATACRALGVTAHAVWGGVISALVSRLCGRHGQVFRSTYANRFTPADLGAVAQLAQAVFLPIDGEADDTLRVRVERVARTSFTTLDRGTYDANALLDWLNSGAGAVFQPAFELNYVPAGRGATPAAPEPRRVEVTDMRIDPPSAKADLAVTVSHLPGSVLRLAARRPVSRQRGARDLSAACLTILEALSANPDTPIDELPIEPFPATATLRDGHHTGVAVDADSTTRLVTSVPGILACRLEFHDRRLLATVTTREPVTPTGLRALLARRQPWFSGAVVPDDFVINDTPE
jgi:hypothetical protein